LLFLILKLRLRKLGLFYNKQSEPEVLQRSSVNNGEIMMNQLKPYQAAIPTLLAAYPSLTLQELRDWLKQTYVLETSVSVVVRFPSDRLSA
jgi:hypothetical protein